MRYLLYLLVLVGIYVPSRPVQADLNNDMHIVHACSVRLGVPTTLLKLVLRNSVNMSPDFLMTTLALIKAESGYNFNARSSEGAVGLMQLTPIAIKELQSSSDARCRNIKGSLVVPATNIHAGTCYLDYLWHKGQVSALLEYNGGSRTTSLLDAGFNTLDESAGHAIKILYWLEKLCGT